jgi:hypothetical protein
MPCEELLVQLVFELRYLHAQCGLHDVQSLRCARDRTVFKQRDEILDLLEIHSDLNGPSTRGHQSGGINAANEIRSHYQVCAGRPTSGCAG